MLFRSKEVVLLKASNSSNDVYGPIKYPNNIPPTHGYTLTSNANTFIIPEGFATSGYMQVVDPKYTPEQIEEWSKIRYTPQ